MNEEGDGTATTAAPVTPAPGPRRQLVAGPGGRRPSPLLVVLALATLALVALPLVYLVVRSLEGRASAWSVLTRAHTGEVIADTLLLVVGVAGCSLLLGVGLAWAVVRTDLPFRRVVGTLAALPLVVPSYVAALCLLGAFGPRGLLQQVLGSLFGVERIPEIYGYTGALLALTLSTYPYVFLLAAAALSTLDPALEEAARSLGRSRGSTFLRVVLPALRPSLGAGTLLVALYTLSDFGAVSLMQYNALTRSIYLQYRSLFDRTPAAVLSLALVALTAVVLLLEARTRSRGRQYRSTPGTARATVALRLGRWRWPALAACAVPIGFFAGVPLAVLGYWLARGVANDQSLEFAWGAVGNSLLVAVLAAVAAIVFAWPVAFLAQRQRAGWATAIERACFGANALPGIVIALSLVYFGARYATPLYQTLTLLVAAYVVRFLPQALAGVTSGLGTVSPRLEEASRGLGRSQLATIATVTLPMARRGVLAGAALVLLSTLKELPATLLLRPIGFDTLATEIWRTTSLGYYSRAALPALVLIAISAPFVFLLQARGALEGERPD